MDRGRERVRALGSVPGPGMVWKSGKKLRPRYRRAHRKLLHLKSGEENLALSPLTSFVLVHALWEIHRSSMLVGAFFSFGLVIVLYFLGPCSVGGDTTGYNI